ncbi:uncharacterized protein TNCV_3271971 [Trichonephila clavipes]|nr:uncharacterized protein TNCV_3271971 [Trichonephila clavipes]
MRSISVPWQQTTSLKKASTYNLTKRFENMCESKIERRKYQCPYSLRANKLWSAFGSPYGFTCRNCGGGDRGRVAIYRPFGEVSLSLNRTVTCMVLKANDGRTSCPCHDEFRGPRSDYVRQVALATTTT